MPFSVAEALDRFVEALEEPREPDGLWHPSSLFFGCDRRVIYEVRGTPPTNERGAADKRVLRIGHVLHGVVQAAVATKGEGIAEVWTEVDISDPGLKIAGHADQLVRFKDGSYELQEYKTIKKWAFKNAELPKPDHVLQALTYVMVLRDIGSPQDGIAPLPDLHRARITYVEKEGLALSEHLVFLTPEIEQEIKVKIATLESYREGPLPARLDRDPKTGKFQWQCNYCPFTALCWEGDE